MSPNRYGGCYNKCRSWLGAYCEGFVKMLIKIDKDLMKRPVCH